jgi:hypothetical protein
MKIRNQGFYTPDLGPPTAALIDFVSQLAVGAQPGVERREVPRLPTAFPATVVLLTEEMEPAGEPFDVVVRNISTKGLAFLSSQQIDVQHVGVTLTNPSGAEVELQVRVRRCQPLGPCFDVGGEFMNRVTSTEDH